MNEQEVRKILTKALTSTCLYCHHTQIDNYKVDRTLASLKSLEPKVDCKNCKINPLTTETD